MVTISKPNGMIDHPEVVLGLVRDFIDEHNIVEAEQIDQSDRIREDLADLMVALCTAAGYAELEPDEDEDITDGDFDIDNPYDDDD